jgi:CHASE2 domain-containing sensor protein
VASGLTFGWLEEMESRTWDWRIRAVASPAAADKKIAIVLIDQTSLEHFARYEKIYWPWPRSL